MSARNLLPVAAALAEPVAPELPKTSRAWLLARAALVYRRCRELLRREEPSRLPARSHRS